MSMDTNNGICEKDSKGNRKHQYTDKTDVHGNTYRSCDLCGNLPTK